MSITLKGLGSAVDSVNGKTGIVVLSPEDLGADSAGAASAAIAQHEVAADPHPQYLTETEADAKYATIGSGGTGGDPAGTAASLLAAHEAAADPHPQYLTQSEGDTQYAPKMHSHTSSQISDFSEAVEDMIGESIVAGAGVSVAYNEGTGKTTISASGGGGGGYAVQARNGSLANQVHAFGLPAAQSSYGFDAYALKEEAGLTNQVVAVESFDSSSSVNYAQTGELVWNGSLSAMKNTSSSVGVNIQDGEYFYSGNQTHENLKLSIVQATVKNNEKLTGNSTPAGYSATASSLYPGSGTQAFHAFDNNGTTLWSSAQTAGFPQWVQIEYPSPRVFDSYDIVNRTTSTAAYVHSVNSWTLQGSNDGVSYTDLHSVSNDTRNQSGLIKNFQIPSPGAYKFYRVYVTNANTSGDPYVSIAEVNFYEYPSPLALVGADSRLFTVSGGTLVETTDQGQWNGGTVVDTSSLIEPFKIRSSTPTTVSLLKIPYAQIAIPNSLLGAGAFSQINSATATATQTGNGKVRLAVSRDLVNWYSWNGSAWISIGTLAADTTSAEAMLTGGMAPATIGGITVAQWNQFFASSEGGSPDKIAFAYALDVPSPTTDTASIDNVALNVNYNSAWLKQTPAQVEIRWYKDQVTFKTITAGNYKLAYQTP